MLKDNTKNVHLSLSDAPFPRGMMLPHHHERKIIL